MNAQAHIHYTMLDDVSDCGKKKQSIMVENVRMEYDDRWSAKET